MKRVSGNLVNNICLLLIHWHSFIFSCWPPPSLPPSTGFYVSAELGRCEMKKKEKWW